MDKKEAMALPRWHLTRLIQELATKAYREGVGGYELHKYARGIEEDAAVGGSGEPGSGSGESTNYITEELKYKCKY